MSEIVVMGHRIDTKDIWDIALRTDSYEASVTIKVTDKPDIKIGRSIPYETYQSEYAGYYAPYKKLYKELMEKWEADKSELPVFKI